nr:tetratricopeptide repeat protein [Pelagicoccus albus]
MKELSRLYHANGLTNEAWKCYATLIVADPSEPRWPYQLGRILAGYGRLEEATPLFEKTVDLAPDYLPARIRLGDTLLKQNLTKEAGKVYQGVLSKDESNAYALVGVARVAIADGDWQLARKHLEQSVQATNFQIGADLLGDVYKQLGLSGKERIVLQNMEWGSYADIPDPWSLTLMDDCYDAYQVSIAGGWVAHQGDKRTGFRYIKRAADLDPNTAIYQYQLAGAYMDLNDPENAEIHFRRCVEIQPSFGDAWLALISIARDRNSPTSARRILEEGLKAAPESPSLNIEKGNVLVAQRQFEKAYPYFHRSIELRSHEAGGFIALAQAYIKEGRIEEGMEQMREALVREPANPIVLSSMAFDAIMKSDKSAADKWFKRIRQQARFLPEDLNRIESMYFEVFGTAAPK